MAKKDRFPGGYSSGFATNHESEGSGSSGQDDNEIAVSHSSSAPMRKCINLNSAASDGLGVPTQLLPLPKMTSYERKESILRLKAELEQIRNYQKRVMKQRTSARALPSSSDILSYSNPQNAPLVEKKINTPCNKARGWNRGTSGRFESPMVEILPAGPSMSDVLLMKQCEGLLKKLMEHQFGWVFNAPVDVVKLNIPDYFTVIKHPMDLGTVKKRIGSSGYGPRDFAADVRLTFSNAMTYNPRGNDVHFMADTLSKFFEVRWKVIEKKLPKEPPLQEKPGVNEGKEIDRRNPPSKKRKIPSTQLKIDPDIVKTKMTNEEKLKLSRELEAVLGELPDAIIEFLREQSSNGKETGEDEIEIDINDLSYDALFQLRKLLDEFLQMRARNHGEAEHCEIELRNESGFSNSSMEMRKGDNPIDEDVDIGGNEPPVSSFPPVAVVKDAGSGFSECKLDSAEPSNPLKPPKEKSVPEAVLNEKMDADLVIENQSDSGLDQSDQFLQKTASAESDSYRDGESPLGSRQTLPDKQYRVALLKNRFLDTILKAREKTINQGEKGDPDRLRREKEELEMQRRREKARLQAEAKAAEDARMQAEAEAAAEAKRKRELEREAARQALLKMEKTVEINENSRFLEDLEMLSAPLPEQLPSSVDETSPDHSQDGLGSFKFGGTNPLEQLGLYMKLDEEDEEGEPPRAVPNVTDDVEEGEID